MYFEAQDSTKLIILMIAGAAFAGAGLWLLLRPRPDGTTAKFELFGLKFESSSAGILVFLIGAAFIVIPLFVPEKSVTPRDIDHTEPGERESNRVESNAPKSGSGAPEGFKKIDQSTPAPEYEPNDTIDDAQLVLPNQWFTGTIGHNQVDWLLLPVPPGQIVDEIKVRRTDGSGIVVLQVFDAREQLMVRTEAAESTGYLHPDSEPVSKLYLRVSEKIGLSASYELQASISALE